MRCPTAPSWADVLWGQCHPLVYSAKEHTRGYTRRVDNAPGLVGLRAHFSAYRLGDRLCLGVYHNRSVYIIKYSYVSRSGLRPVCPSCVSLGTPLAGVVCGGWTYTHRLTVQRYEGSRHEPPPAR